MGDDAPTAEAPISDRPALEGAWWVPLALIVTALLLLLVTPIVVNSNIRTLRRNEADVLNQARVAVNDFEAAFATEFVTRAASGIPASVRDSILATEQETERSDERELEQLIARIRGRAPALFATLRHWQSLRESALGPVGSVGGVADPTADSVRTQLLISAERLDDYLRTQSLDVSARVQRLEQDEVVLAVVLAPVALMAAVLVFFLGRRLRYLAHTADEERRAMLRATRRRTLLMQGVTHDIKNPLGAALGYAALLADGVAGPLGDNQREMSERIRRLVGVAQETISDLLELARADSGALHIARRPVDLRSLVRDLVRDYDGSATPKGLSLIYADTAAPLPVQADASRVREVLGNLVSNAIKYTPPGGSIRVTIVEPPATAQPPEAAPRGGEGRVGIAVRDTGPGVPPELRERIFDEFYRLQGSAAQARGTGLGLAIGRRLARLMGGDITVDSAPEGGAAFTLWLPVRGSPELTK